jgi:hypothetical protein
MLFVIMAKYSTTDRIAGAASEINALKDAFNRGRKVLDLFCMMLTAYFQAKIPYAARQIYMRFVILSRLGFEFCRSLFSRRLLTMTLSKECVSDA